MTEQDLRQRLESAEAELESQQQRQQTLSYGLSHDLRASIRAIDGFARVLQQQEDSLDDTGRDYLRRIREASVRMGALLDGLQELSLAGRAPLQRQTVDVSMLADWVGAELQDAHPGRDARVEVAQGLQVEGDERWLKTLLAKVMDNAWKFSADRKQVWITVEGEADGDRLRLRVRDHGLGFDMRYADKLFEPFQRLHGPEQGAGPGIGLAIAQCIAQRHGGRIRGESTVGEGSVFHLELPLRQVHGTKTDD